MDNKAKHEVLDRTSELYNGRILNLKVDDVILPNGKKSVREYIDHKDAVAVLVKKEDQFWFVKQYRYAVGKELLEIPAGLIEEGELPEQAAVRELQEEIGLKPEELKLLAAVYVSPGCSTEKIYLYFTEKLVPGRLAPDDDEFIDLVKYSVEEVKTKYLRGEFADAKTVAALGYYFVESKKGDL